MTAKQLPKTNVFIPPKPVTVLEHPEQCRFCDRMAFIADEDGPLHRCCEMWAVELADHRRCPSCDAGRDGNKVFQGRQERRKWR